jgi:hypothetical protein
MGIIILPGDESFSVIRVRTTEGSSTYERVKYLWYAQDVRLPLFVILEDYSISKDGTKKLVGTQSFLNTQAKSPTSIQSPLADTFSYQVFPNPFKGELQFTYSLSEPAFVTAVLLTSDGAQLVTLVSGQQESGQHSIVNDVSKYTQLPGVYLLKITVGNKTFTEKLVKTY